MLSIQMLSSVREASSGLLHQAVPTSKPRPRNDQCVSSSTNRSYACALASCAVSVVAGVNGTLLPAMIASRPIATARWVLPTLGGPSCLPRPVGHLGYPGSAGDILDRIH